MTQLEDIRQKSHKVNPLLLFVSAGIERFLDPAWPYDYVSVANSKLAFQLRNQDRFDLVVIGGYDMGWASELQLAASPIFLPKCYRLWLVPPVYLTDLIKRPPYMTSMLSDRTSIEIIEENIRQLLAMRKG